MENKPKINVKRFSRSKIETNETPIIEKNQEVKRKLLLKNQLLNNQ